MKKYILIILLCLNLYGANKDKSLKIVSIGGSITEAVVALGGRDKLIGVDLSSSYPKDLKKSLPNVGYWLNLSKEGILSLKPDIVIASEYSKPKKALEELKNFGIKVHMIEDKPTLQSTMTKIKQIGDILNAQKKANEITKKIQKEVEYISKEIQKQKNKPKTLFIFYGRGGMRAGGVGTQAHAMIEMSGGKNAVDFNQYRQISPEGILEMNPDVILISTHGRNIHKNIEESPIALSKAWKNKKVHFVDTLLLLGFSARLDEALKTTSCMINNVMCEL